MAAVAPTCPSAALHQGHISYQHAAINIIVAYRTQLSWWARQRLTKYSLACFSVFTCVKAHTIEPDSPPAMRCVRTLLPFFLAKHLPAC